LRGRLVLDRGAARLVGLALLGAGLVHGAGGDLLRLVLGGTLVELAVLDVLVLALTLLAPCLGHDSSCSRRALACEMRTDRGPRARRRWRRWPLGPDPHPHARARRGRDSPPNGRGAGRACRAEGARSLPAGVPGHRADAVGRGGVVPPAQQRADALGDPDRVLLERRDGS